MHMDILYIFIYIDFALCYTLPTRSTLIGPGMCRLQMGEAENAGRLQVPEIGFLFFEKDSWRFGGGESVHVL
jgi:hypothetical protein